jgi:hypothetical protein
MTNIISSQHDVKEYFQESPLQSIAKSIPKDHYKINPAAVDASVFALDKKLIYYTYLASGNARLARLAIAATYMKEKKGLKNLYVCTSRAAFEKAFAQVQASPQDTRVAFIVFDRWRELSLGPISHFWTIGIEKTNSTLKVACLDGLGQDADEIADQFKPNFFDTKNLEIYFSSVRIQNDGIGCETFALRFGVDFLEDSQFFNHIQTKLKKHKIRNAPVYKITRLPLPFMKMAQSFNLLRDYLQTHQGDTKPLESAISKHSFCSPEHETYRNYYNEERAVKYLTIALTAMKTLPPQEFYRTIFDSLLTEKKASHAKL